MFKKRTSDNSVITVFRVLRRVLKISKNAQTRFLIIGDSHASHFCRYLQDKTQQNQFILCWLGPRLVYSVSKKGLNLSLFQISALKLWNPDYCYIWLGEIDVRMHLVKNSEIHQDTYNWLEDFFKELEKLWIDLRKPSFVLFSPIPQCNNEQPDALFPAYGSIQDRVSAHREFVAKLTQYASNAGFPIKFINLTTVLEGPDGQLRSRFSDDSCHLNELGFKAIEKLWALN